MGRNEGGEAGRISVPFHFPPSINGVFTPFGGTGTRPKPAASQKYIFYPLYERFCSMVDYMARPDLIISEN